MKMHFLLSALTFALTILLPFTYSVAQATTAPLWADVGTNTLQKTAVIHEEASLLRKQKPDTQRRTLQLDQNQLQERIQSPTESQTPLWLEVPLPDGSNTSVELRPVNTLSAGLRQRYPDIKTWRISTTDPRILSGRAELTGLGFQIMLRSNSGEQWLIEPIHLSSTSITEPSSSSARQPATTAQNHTLTQSASNHYQSYRRRQSNQTAQTLSLIHI